ncbi:alcohol dehydrogenase catalytic domain-containing protein [Enterococcus sp. AZ072]|uniref:alcohol dehydrogenase catalytic domain-containing protein n=1 Tax=unclassified Enterococcus TaxID=2608891 RepID=UPI003D2CBCFE
MAKNQTNTYWPFGGKGLASFGVNDQLLIEELPVPKEDEVLARVDAYTICASDVKMIHMGNDYPLFKDRDFTSQPARLGHELALTVVTAGKNRRKEWSVGKRFGVQPDVYLNGDRYCIGVNVNGGMAEYILLGAEVFSSDMGSCAFPITGEFSAAAIAQTEPVACVEAAFINHTRSHYFENDRIFLWIDPKADKVFMLDSLYSVSTIQVYDPADRLHQTVMLPELVSSEKLSEIPEGSFDGVIVVGNPTNKELTGLTELLNPKGIFAWLPEYKPDRYAELDIAKVHYNKLNLAASMSGKLSEALNPQKYRYDYSPGGTLIISGGGGAMGRIHVMRALQHENPPSKIIVTTRSSERHAALHRTFDRLAKEKDIELITLVVEKDSYKEKMWAIVGNSGASDIIVCAPGVSPIDNVVEFLAENGLIVLFAGTSYGHFAKLPLGMVATQGVSITASSGSSVADQTRVIEKMRKKQLDPDVNIAAIGGLSAGKDGILAVKNGMYSGKVIIFPHLFHLPLTALEDLDKISPRLAAKVQHEGWSKSAEDLLAEIWQKGEK